MTLTLGSTPQSLEVILVEGADFISALDSVDAAGAPDNWPGTAVISLKFNDTANTVWTATITAAAADWNVDKADVAALESRLPSYGKVELTYLDGTTDLLWFHGKVKRVGF